MNMLITGGTGSLGALLVKKYTGLGHNVTVLSRDAHKQALLAAEVPCRMLLGDICDRRTVARAVHGQDVVIHAAALKRIERGATDPEEYLRVNTIGAQVVVQEAALAEVREFLLISTDKVVDPSTFYGLTKALAETICLSYNKYMRVAALRYGNVMDSAGSFWWLWKALLADDQPIPVRQPFPTRFILTKKQAIELVAEALTVMLGGEVFVPRYIKAVAMDDIARTLTHEDNWQIMPLQANEKLHEVLVGSMEHCRVASAGLTMLATTDYDDTLKPFYCSATAPRMTGKDAVKLLQGV
jgi:UDP-N-acetylglucosamine 4,6-dehydratase